MKPGPAPTGPARAAAAVAFSDITPTFSPWLDDVFTGRKPTGEGNDNKIYHSRMVDGR